MKLAREGSINTKKARLKNRLELLESADEAVKAIVPPFGENIGIDGEDRSDLLTALCIIGEHRNRCCFALKRLQEENGNDSNNS